MRKYWKEILISTLQVLLFYVLPLFSGPTDGFGLVVLLIILTFILSFLYGVISKNKLKFLYPLGVGVVFTPTIFLYYNSSATIHILWYFVLSLIGICGGTTFRCFCKFLDNGKRKENKNETI